MVDSLCSIIDSRGRSRESCLEPHVKVNPVVREEGPKDLDREGKGKIFSLCMTGTVRSRLDRRICLSHGRQQYDPNSDQETMKSGSAGISWSKYAGRRPRGTVPAESAVVGPSRHLKLLYIDSPPIGVILKSVKL